ncbi:MAG: cysteine--tRNA ligase [Pseudonocardiales bacterium]|nr:MAG: cysteine--tRNA ligase [Pseudonocardiales bacterium]
MSLRLYDTATREVRDFTPLEPGRAGIYLCGATVQSPPHIGHIRSGVNFDIVWRWLEHRGYAVTFCRNVTDIDDKIIHAAAHEDAPWWAVATRNERAFRTAYELLGCRPPTVEPRATGHVPEMVALMQRLVDAGHAYAAEGDVYFDVRSFPTYGALSGRDLDDMLASEKSLPGKRDPADFALWKGAKPGEPAWDTPWGPGRPGWHLECSAMAHKYLGSAFDIHGGGVDLIFPHHENELAQSTAAGDRFVSYWLHHAWVTASGEKMGKSLGNSLLVTEVVQRVRPVELRYYLGAAHYRSHIEFSEAALQEAAAAYRRIEGFVQRAGELVGDLPVGQVPDAFAASMDDDLGVPGALAVLHNSVRDGNTALAAASHQAVDKETVARLLGEVRGMLAALGLDPLSEPWAGDPRGGGDLRPVVEGLVAVALEQRAAARARHDFAAADAIRDELAEIGVSIEDTSTGPRWSIG